MNCGVGVFKLWFFFFWGHCLFKCECSQLFKSLTILLPNNYMERFIGSGSKMLVMSFEFKFHESYEPLTRPILWDLYLSLIYMFDYS